MLSQDVLKQIKHIQLRTSRMANDLLQGSYHSAFKGQGMEFDQVREYEPGDDVRAIDWNVTARMDSPFIKQYVEEREITVMLLVDVSASGLFGSKNRLKKEVAAEFAAVIASSAIKNHDKVGLLLFSDQVESYIPPRKGRGHVWRVIQEILTHKPCSSGTSLETALTYMNHVLKRKAIVFLVSDFFDHSYEKALRFSRQRHDVMAAIVRDSQENHLPPIGVVTLQDPETKALLHLDSRSAQAQLVFAKARQEQDQVLHDKLRQMAIDHLWIQPDKPYLNDLIRLFQVRTRSKR